MKNNSIDHYFYKQLQHDIDRVDTKADRFRAMYYLLRTLLIIIGASITFISGWNSENQQASRIGLNALLSLGVFSTAITAFDALFQIETKKNTYRLYACRTKRD
jgi:NADH:ubiquinone oxidoreductase subunit 3 (subunit A)